SRGLLCSSHRWLSKQENGTFSLRICVPRRDHRGRCGARDVFEDDSCISGNGKRGGRNLTQATRQYAILPRFDLNDRHPGFLIYGGLMPEAKGSVGGVRVIT